MRNQASTNTTLTGQGWSRDRIDRTRPLRDQIYAMIRLMILTGELPPGGPLDEKAIAAELGVSRTPVREAVQKLSDENLIEIKPQSGTLVAAFSRSNIHQAFLIRRALESVTVAAATKAMTPKSETRLDGNVFQHELAIERGEFVEAIRFDDDFHRTIAEVADLPLLWRAITVFKAQLDRCRYQTVPQEGYGAATLQQHKAVIAAMKARDSARASAMMEAHLDQTYAGIVKFLDRADVD